jgi:hypothetical protein
LLINRKRSLKWIKDFMGLSFHGFMGSWVHGFMGFENTSAKLSYPGN